MKKITSIILLFFTIIQAQNINTSNFKRGIVKDLMEKHKSNELRFQENDVTYTLDSYKSVTFYSDGLFQKMESTYDTNGNETLIIRNDWDTATQTFVPYLKYESTYDTNGNKTLRIQYSDWDTATQSFVAIIKEESTYDANGNVTLYLEYWWNAATQSFGPPLIKREMEYTYDANDNVTLYISYNWDSATQSFVPYSKYESTYDTNGNKTLYISYNWDSATQSFVPSRKREYTYDTNGNETLYIRYDWYSTTQSFVYGYKRESTYDANGNKTLQINYSGNRFTNSLIPNSKWQFTYDANGNKTLYILYDWDASNQTFVPESKREYAYDANGNETLHIYNYWDTDIQSFVPRDRDVYIYDYNFSSIRPLLSWKVEKYYPELGVFKPSFIQEYSVHTDTETDYVIEGITKQYDTNFNTWNELEGEEFKSYWYYTKISELSDEDITNITFKVYPNPANNFTNIDSTLEGNYNIVSMLGKTVAKGSLKAGENTLDISTLNKGIYFLNISSNNNSKTLKIVKQ